MQFLDEIKIQVTSGKGGDGCISFHRAKFIEFGGPDGGNGGRGGAIIFQAVGSLNTLVDYRYKRHFKAQSGRAGKGDLCTGAKGEDLILKVPCGTQIFSEDKVHCYADLVADGQKYVLLKGGDGGFGNAHYKSSTNQAPRRSSPGGAAQELWIWLHLKLIADVGVVGLPNAGKSTLLAALTAARPKIGDYPFTTLQPQLGVIQYGEQELVLADIPGLIEGASQGIGLGDRFLSHIERCRALLHLIDGASEDIVRDYKIVRHEMEMYGKVISTKNELVILNKADKLLEEELQQQIEKLRTITSTPILAISALGKLGIEELIQAIFKLHQDTNQTPAESAPKPWTPLY